MIRAELAAADDRERFRVLARKVFCAHTGRRSGAQGGDIRSAEHSKGKTALWVMEDDCAHRHRQAEVFGVVLIDADKLCSHDILRKKARRH